MLSTESITEPRFSKQVVINIVGLQAPLTPGQFQHWVSLGKLPQPEKEKHVHRRYSIRDIIAIAIAAHLSNLRFPISEVGPIAQAATERFVNDHSMFFTLANQLSDPRADISTSILDEIGTVDRQPYLLVWAESSGELNWRLSPKRHVVDEVLEITDPLVAPVVIKILQIALRVIVDMSNAGRLP